MITDAYNLRDIQMFLSMLNQFESKGVTDVRFVRQQCSNELTKRAGKPGRVTARRSKYKSVAPKYGTCPDCGRGVLVGPYDLEGLIIVRCSVKCGFSKVVE